MQKLNAIELGVLIAAIVILLEIGASLFLNTQ
jgi:hypothetical protein